MHSTPCPRLVLVIAAIALGGCASLSEKQCRGQDWSGIGYRDGLAGRNEYRVNDHQVACAKHGISLDIRTYDAGRLRGLDRYCTVDGGLRSGRSGNTYEGVCPADSEPGFLVAHRLGLEMHRVDSRLSALRNERSTIFNRLRELSQYKREPKKEGEDQDKFEEEERRRQRGFAKERESLNLRLIEIEHEEFRLDDDFRHLEWEARRLH